MYIKCARSAIRFKCNTGRHGNAATVQVKTEGVACLRLWASADRPRCALFCVSFFGRKRLPTRRRRRRRRRPEGQFSIVAGRRRNKSAKSVAVKCGHPFPPKSRYEDPLYVRASVKRADAPGGARHSRSISISQPATFCRATAAIQYVTAACQLFDCLIA